MIKKMIQATQMEMTCAQKKYQSVNQAFAVLVLLNEICHCRSQYILPFSAWSEVSYSEFFNIYLHTRHTSNA